MKDTVVVGLTLDTEEGGGYSSYPYYVLRKNYASALARYQVAPIYLPHHVDLAEHYLSIIDGLVVTGGDFDIGPQHYGETVVHKTVVQKNDRTVFEMRLIQLALAQRKPILGICGGQQLLNVVLGGTLIQHIPDEVLNSLQHEQRYLSIPNTQASHEVEIVADTLLSRIVKTHTMQVNSSHHQAVKKVAPGVTVNAFASDGVIEGIEYQDHPFCLGVQWHPEYGVTDNDEAIFQAFTQACVNAKKALHVST